MVKFVIVDQLKQFIPMSLLNNNNKKGKRKTSPSTTTRLSGGSKGKPIQSGFKEHENASSAQRDRDKNHFAGSIHLFPTRLVSVTCAHEGIPEGPE